MSVQRDLFDLDPGDQRQVVAMGEREILRAAKEIRARQSKSRLAARMERHATLAPERTDSRAEPFEELRTPSARALRPSRQPHAPCL